MSLSLSVFISCVSVLVLCYCCCFQVRCVTMALWMCRCRSWEPATGVSILSRKQYCTLSENWLHAINTSEKRLKPFWVWWIHQFAKFWLSPNIAAGYLKIDCNLIGPKANFTIVSDLSISGKNNLAKRHFYPSLNIYCWSWVQRRWIWTLV